MQDAAAADAFARIGLKDNVSIDGDPRVERVLTRSANPEKVWTDWAASAGTDADNSEWVVEDRPTATYTPSTLGSHEIVQTPSGLSEGFEGSFPPYGWTMVSMNDNNSISQSSSSAYEGDYSARFSSYYSASSSTGDYTQYMVSPKLVVGSGESFSFWHNQSDWSGEKFMIGISISTNTCRRKALANKVEKTKTHKTMALSLRVNVPSGR